MKTKIGILLSYFSKRNIRFEILFVFLALQIITIIFLVIKTHNIGIDAMLSDAYKVMEGVGGNKVKKLINRYKVIENNLKLGSSMVVDFNDVSLSNTKFLRYAVDVLKRFDEVDSFFVGMTNGVFFNTQRVIHKQTKYQNDKERYVIKEADFLIRLIVDTEDRRTETWYYLDDQYTVVDKEEIDEKNIKLKYKEREWYKNVFIYDDISWSSIYMDAVNRMPVVAASFPLKNKEGNIIGAICSRSNINTLQKVLKKESINSTSVIIDENGNLVVHPDINDNISELNSKIQILSLKDFSDKSFYTAFKKRKKNKKNEFIFDYKNVPHIVYFFDFGDDLFKKWSFLSIAPIKFFVGDIQESRIKIIFIMIFVIFLSFIYIIYLVKRISGPILNLVKLTNHIRNFDLILDEINFSNLIEVKKLQQSIVAMRDSFLIFLKFVPKNLAHIFIEEEIEVKVGGELKKITVLFSGIEDFTIIVKNSEPYQLMNHLSEYFDNLTRIIIDSKGNIDKYNGDSIMAFWGAPLADENATLHACEAALYCQKKLSDLNRKWAFEKKPIFTTRFGIHAGDVIVGNLGSTERMNYTVIGDDVNIASRLERTNKFYGTNILITQHVYDLLKEYVIARQLDIIALKGKNTAIEVYELIALKGADPLLLPTGTEVDLCDKFQQAFDSYLNQEWDLACKILQEIKIRHPYDKPTDILLGRCLNYKKLSPGKAWDPISYLSVK